MSSSGSILRNAKRAGVIVLSLVPTPLLIFVSSSAALYLKNQDQLQRRLDVLLPFGAVLFLTVVLGLLLYGFSRYRPVRLCLMGYYALGPLFLLFGFLRSQLDVVSFMARFYNTMGGLLLWPGLLLVATVILHLRSSVQKVAKVSAVAAVILLAAEVFSFHSEFERRAPVPTGSIREKLSSDPSRSLPNIYHILLDGFQTDFFERALTPELRQALDGFTYYPANESIYHTTFLSTSSMFTGRTFAYDRHRHEFLFQARNGRASFLYWLKKSGYATLVFSPARIVDEYRVRAPGRARLVDHIALFGQQVTDELIAVNTAALRNLWLYSMLPDPLKEIASQRDWFAGLDQEDLRLLQRQRLLNRSAQMMSVLGLRSILKEEPSLPESSRYTYIHLMLPHWPYNLRPDCSFKNDGKTSPVEQSQCTLALMADFLTLLKSLDRFDRSLILIHGDHGAFYRVKNGALVPTKRSRARRCLLLVKPFNRGVGDGLVTSERNATLLDINPTILWSVAGIQAEGNSTGASMELADHQIRLVPFIEGETLPSAKRILERQGFAPGRVLTTHSSIYAAGTVIAQDPAPYKEANGAKQVTLLLSTGNRDDANLMPDFVGRNVGEIIEEIIERTRRGSFPEARFQYVEHVSADAGTVVAQTPPPEAKVEEDHQVVLYISKGQ
jgi:hypothetical protein